MTLSLREVAVQVQNTIHAENVDHVAYGSKWLDVPCGRQGLDPSPAFLDLVRRHFLRTAKATVQPGKARPSRVAAEFLPAIDGPRADALKTAYLLYLQAVQTRS
jgi:uncharacterized ferritin-like protein (DUF455 family)